MTKSYVVKVSREDSNLLAEIVDLRGAHTFAGNLITLEASVREVIALIEDLSPEAENDVELHWDFSALGSLAAQAYELQLERERVQASVDDLALRTRRTIAALVRDGWSTRDIAGLVGTSAGRVSQIIHEADRRAP